MNRYLIETYGCQMNKAESDALELELSGKGWKETELPEQAAAVIINTCSVRKTAEDRIYGRIGFYKKVKETNPDLKLIITGCMAERLGNELKKGTSPVDYVCGTFNKNRIVDFINNSVKDPDSSSVFEFQKLHYHEDSFKSFIPIMHGCNNFCSYCIVPYVRGREVSRGTSDILDEIKFLESRNVKEITLLGQNVNSYKTEIDFPELLELIVKNTESIEWIRFTSSHPKDVTEKLISVISENDKICNHFHLPVQHGSDRILKLMNRKYDTKYYLDYIGKLKKAVPGISITTDIMVGFPGETDEDFQKVIDIMEKVRYSDAFTYYYNPRKGTASYDMEDSVPKEVKLDRLDKIIKLQRKISLEEKQKKIGTVCKVLVESVSKNNSDELLARNESDEMIVFNGKHDKIGSFLNLKIISLQGNTLKGVIVSDEI